MQMIDTQLGRNLIEQVFDRFGADGREHLPSVFLGVRDKWHFRPSVSVVELVEQLLVSVGRH